MRVLTVFLTLYLVVIELVFASLKFELPSLPELPSFNFDIFGLGSQKDEKYDDSYDQGAYDERYGNGYGNSYGNDYKDSNYYKQKIIDLGLPLGAIGGLGLGIGVGAVKGLLLGSLLANKKATVKHIYPSYGNKYPTNYGGYGSYSTNHDSYSDDHGSNNGLGFDFGLHKNTYHVY